MSIKKKKIEEVGLFDESLISAEDLDISLRIGNFVYNPYIVVSHNTSRIGPKEYLKNCYRNGVGSLKVRQKNKSDVLCSIMSIGRIFFALAMIPLSLVFALRMAQKSFKAFKISVFLIPFLFIGRMSWCLGCLKGMTEER